MRAHDPPITSFGYDDDLITAACRDGEPRVAVYRLRGPAVVLGRGSDPARELHLDACLEDGVVLMRRRGGGCAVVLDEGCVVVSVVLPDQVSAWPSDNRRCLERLTDWLARGLASAGAEGARREGICDIAVGGRKIAGSCLYRTRGYALYSASILVRPHVELMERYLGHPPREPAYRRERAHQDFVGQLADTGLRLTPDELVMALGSELQARDLNSLPEEAPASQYPC
jgi:lipoate-protein ligase A